MRPYFLFFFMLMSAAIVMLPACSSSPNEQTAQTAAAPHPCANCGMHYEDFPKWHARLQTAENELFFCSARCMFVNIKNDEVAPESLSQVQVMDYYTLEEVDGKAAYYVTGSDVNGPMGPDFIAFSTKEAAEDFATEHQGDNIYPFNKIDAGVIKIAVKPKN